MTRIALPMVMVLSFVLGSSVALGAPPVGEKDGLLQQAEAELQLGAHSQAAAIARGVLRDHPADKAALKVVATASCFLHDPVGAMHAARGLPWVDQVLLAELCAKNGIALLSQGPQPVLRTMRARRLYAEGLLLQEKGDCATAEILLRRAFKTEPASAILFEIARCQAWAGQLQRALVTHRRYVRSFRSPKLRLAAAARFGVLVDETTE